MLPSVDSLYSPTCDNVRWHPCHCQEFGIPVTFSNPSRPIIIVILDPVDDVHIALQYLSRRLI